MVDGLVQVALVRGEGGGGGRRLDCEMLAQ